jgi:hypothetical protein
MKKNYSNYSYGQATTLLYSFIHQKRKSMKEEKTIKLLRLAASVERQPHDYLMEKTDLTVFLDRISGGREAALT